MVVAKTEATGDEVPLSLVDFWDGILFDKIHASQYKQFKSIIGRGIDVWVSMRMGYPEAETLDRLGAIR
jgi:hypothetical protein